MSKKIFSEQQKNIVAEVISDLKAIFGEYRVWTRDDSDFYETAKVEKFNMYETAICFIYCYGEYSDLHYYNCYSGNAAFQAVVKKHNLWAEWDEMYLKVINFDTWDRSDSECSDSDDSDIKNSDIDLNDKLMIPLIVRKSREKYEEQYEKNNKK